MGNRVKELGGLRKFNVILRPALQDLHIWLIPRVKVTGGHEANLP